MTHRRHRHSLQQLHHPPCHPPHHHPPHHSALGVPTGPMSSNSAQTWLHATGTGPLLELPMPLSYAPTILRFVRRQYGSKNSEPVAQRWKASPPSRIPSTLAFKLVAGVVPVLPQALLTMMFKVATGRSAQATLKLGGHALVALMSSLVALATQAGLEVRGPRMRLPMRSPVVLDSAALLPGPLVMRSAA